MARTTQSYLPLFLGLALLANAPAWGAVPSEHLLPATTKGYLSVPSVADFEEKFTASQWGALASDFSVQPFLDDVPRQLTESLAGRGVRLSLTWQDLRDVSAGEAAVAVIQPDPANKAMHTTVLLLDVTGKAAPAQSLLKKIAADMTAHKAVRSELQSGGVRMTVHTLPKKEGAAVATQVVYYIYKDQLVIADHPLGAQEVAIRLDGAKAGSLAGLPAFVKINERLALADSKPPQIRWFVEPFGLREATRAIAPKRRKRGRDMMQVLLKQGFGAIQGVGGHIFFATGGEEALYRAFVYAPPVAGAEAGEKYTSGARMLTFPNGKDLAPQSFVSRGIGECFTGRNKLQKSFKASATVVNERAKDDVFNDMWANLKLDPAGPQIDIYADLVDHLGERITLISDASPHGPEKGERTILCVELRAPTAGVNPSEIVAKTLKKRFAKDPLAKKREYMGHIIWQLLAEDAAIGAESAEGQPTKRGKAEKPTLKKDKEKDTEAEEEAGDEKDVLAKRAYTVFQGHLVIGSHVEFIQELIKGASQPAPLADTADYKRVAKELTRLGAGEDCFRYFARTEQVARNNYDLFRKGTLPLAETMLAKTLNNLLGQEGVVRKSQLDGAKLPDFDKVQKYLGLTGYYVHTETNGWLLVGAVLKK